jgi:hypothetical protein
MYGVCLIVYTKPSEDIITQCEVQIEEWNRVNDKDADLQYVQGIQAKLAAEKARLEILLSSPASMSSEDRLEAITRTEELVKMYEEMLLPMRELGVSIENLYIPNCIGGLNNITKVRGALISVLSHWPWYDLLKDWLCRINQVLCAQVTNGEVTTSIETYGNE